MADPVSGGHSHSPPPQLFDQLSGENHSFATLVLQIFERKNLAHTDPEETVKKFYSKIEEAFRACGNEEAAMSCSLSINEIDSLPDPVIGKCCFSGGNATLAVKWLKESLELYPNQPSILSALGYALLELGPPVTTREKMEQAFTSDETDETPDEITEYRLANVLYHFGETKSASACLTKLLNEIPSTPGVTFLLGKCFLELGELQKAEECFEKAIALGISEVEIGGAFFQSATAFLRERNLCRPYLEKAMTMMRSKHSTREGFLALGDLEAFQGNYDEAIHCYGEIIGIHLSSMKESFPLACGGTIKHYPDDTYRVLTNHIKKNLLHAVQEAAPYYSIIVEAIVGKGFALLCHHQISTAKNFFRQAKLFSISERIPQGVSSVEIAKETHPLALIGLGQAALIEKKYAQALTLFDEALEILPDHPLAIAGSAAVHFHQKNSKKLTKCMATPEFLALFLYDLVHRGKLNWDLFNKRLKNLGISTKDIQTAKEVFYDELITPFKEKYGSLLWIEKKCKWYGVQMFTWLRAELGFALIGETLASKGKHEASKIFFMLAWNVIENTPAKDLDLETTNFKRRYIETLLKRCLEDQKYYPQLKEFSRNYELEKYAAENKSWFQSLYCGVLLSVAEDDEKSAEPILRLALFYFFMEEVEVCLDRFKELKNEGYSIGPDDITEEYLAVLEGALHLNTTISNEIEELGFQCQLKIEPVRLVITTGNPGPVLVKLSELYLWGFAPNLDDPNEIIITPDITSKAVLLSLKTSSFAKTDIIDELSLKLDRKKVDVKKHAGRWVPMNLKKDIQRSTVVKVNESTICSTALLDKAKNDEENPEEQIESVILESLKKLFDEIEQFYPRSDKKYEDMWFYVCKLISQQCFNEYTNQIGNLLKDHMNLMGYNLFFNGDSTSMSYHFTYSKSAIQVEYGLDLLPVMEYKHDEEDPEFLSHLKHRMTRSCCINIGELKALMKLHKNGDHSAETYYKLFKESTFSDELTLIV